MLMIVFGAGASFDSAHARPIGRFPPETLQSRPPLAQDLFADRSLFAHHLRNFPAAYPIVPYLRQTPEGETIERAMQRLQDEATDFPRRLQQLAAVRLYLQTMIYACETQWQNEHNGITNQVTLLDQVEHWRETTKSPERVWLVTFNYDRMLEAALHRVGHHVSTLDSYVNGGVYRLAKLHGSVDWGREIDEPKAQPTDSISGLVGHIIQNAPTLRVSRRFRLATTTEQPFVRDGNIPLYPAIAIPVETKTEYECPDTHRQALMDDLPNVDQIVTIGWRASEDHFMRLLKERLAKPVNLLAVAGNRAEANEVVLKFILAGIQIVASSSNWGFSDSVAHRELEGFLSARR
jgi:hypothetical protein